MKANSWLYHYYMVQSRLQYSLAYGGQSPTSLAAFYPGMPNSPSFHGQNPFDGHMLHASFMTSPQGGVSHYSGYAGYTPPPGAYNLHQHYPQPHHVDQRSSDSPLGMVSYKMLKTIIFDHEHFKEKFHHFFISFMKNFETTINIGSYLELNR